MSVSVTASLLLYVCLMIYVHRVAAVVLNPHYPVNGGQNFPNQIHLVNWTELLVSPYSAFFPEQNVTYFGNYSYFVNAINFDDAPTGSIFVGGKNHLYELNKTSLSLKKMYYWPPVAADQTLCEDGDVDPEVGCHNHIRLYRSMPFTNANGRLLVCGTNAYKPKCRTLSQFDIESDAGEPTDNSEVAVISLHPDIPFLGGFYDNPDDGYITTGYRENTAWSMYDFGRYNVSYDETNKQIKFETTATRCLDLSNDFHVYPPYYPIKFFKIDLDNGNSQFQMFHFFIREREYASDRTPIGPVRSRVFRICQKDDGVPGKRQNFNTFLKAEIFCIKRTIGTPESVGSQTHYYTGLRDVFITESETRWYDNSNVWHKLVYTAFTGDVYGPNGTAICVYHAESSGPSIGGNILDAQNRGILDVFDLNKFEDESREANTDGENFLDCEEANKRDESDHLVARDPVRPYFGLELPLVEMDGEIVTKIIADQICVRRNKTDVNECVMQDSLFLGTVSGRVMKIAFSTQEDPQDLELDGLTHTAIIAQEWELADSNSIQQLYLKDEGNNQKFLYVTTYSRIYKFPAADCGRHQSCRDCIGSQDPYCYWNSTLSECLLNTIEGNGKDPYILPDSFKQNIHTAEDSICDEKPYCSLSASAYSGLFEIAGFNTCEYTQDVSVIITSAVCPGPPYTQDVEYDPNSVVNVVVIKDSSFVGRRLYNVAVTATINDKESTFDFLLVTPAGPPVIPSSNEIIPGGINDTHVQVVISLDGCNIHDDIQHHTVCVRFSGSLDVEFCEPYSGVNSFIAGPFERCETVTYSASIENPQGRVTTSNYTVEPRTGVPNVPSGLSVNSVTSLSIAVTWSVPSGFCDVTGYSMYINGSKRTDCSVTDTEYIFDGLYADTQYEIAIAACTKAGQSELSDTIVDKTDCNPPFRVQDLSVMTTESDSIIFTWTEPKYHNGTTVMYMVTEECYNKSSLEVELFEQTTVYDSYEINDLQPLMLCCITVVAVTDCTETLQSEVSVVCAETEDDYPGTVRNVNLFGASPNAILVTWSAPDNYSNPGLKYEIRWRPSENDPSTYESTIVIDQLHYLIEGLNKNTDYTVDITSINEIGNGDTATETGLTLPSVPSQPKDVAMNIADCSDIGVSWSKDGLEEFSVTQFVLNVRCNTENRSQTVSFDDDPSFSFNFCAINFNLVWCAAQVYAINIVGAGDFSEWVHKIYPLNTPTKPLCYITEDLGTIVAISFTVSSPYALDRLLVDYSLTSVEYPGKDIVMNGVNFNENFESNVLNFTGLIRYTEYTFKLRFCDAKCSNECTLTFTPTLVPLGPPVDVRIGPIDSTSVSITWSPPPNENASLIEYFIYLTGIGNGAGEYSTNDTSIILSDLSAEMNYSFALRSRDISSGVYSLYTTAQAFTTLARIPNPPQITNANFDLDSDVFYLEVYWIIPLNSKVLHNYTIAWSADVVDDCNDVFDSHVESPFVITNTSISYVRYNNPEGLSRDPSSITICIRSANSRGFSTWNRYLLGDIIVAPISSPEDNNYEIALGVVTVLAIIAMISAIIISILITFACYKYKHNEKNVKSPKKVERGDSTSSSKRLFPGIDNTDSATNGGVPSEEK